MIYNGMHERLGGYYNREGVNPLSAAILESAQKTNYGAGAAGYVSAGTKQEEPTAKKEPTNYGAGAAGYVSAGTKQGEDTNYGAGAAGYVSAGKAAPKAPSYLHDEEDIVEMQKALGVEETGSWNEETEQAYREHMDAIEGMNEVEGGVYQDQPGLAELPFDKNGVKANGCSTTATNNVLRLMGIDVSYEDIYAWHRENEDAKWPGTIPWRVGKYINEQVPGVEIRDAAWEYPVIVPETEDTQPLEERAQRVIEEDGYGILCYAYNQNGIGAHYVAVKKDPETGMIQVYDYVDDKGNRTTEPQLYENIHEFIVERGMNKGDAMLISAWGLSVQ